MTDLHHRLAALSVAADDTAESVVAADVLRGRRAAARRRTVRIATTGAFAIAVGGATATVVASSSDHGPREARGVRLVDYTGRQLPGFTVDKVPAGFVLQGATSYSLDIARPGDHSGLDDFQDKIVVTVEATSSAPPQGRTPIRVKRVGDAIRFYCPDGSIKQLPARKAQLNGLDSSTVCGVLTPKAGADDPTGTASDTPLDVDGSAGRVTTDAEGTKTFRYVDGQRRVVIQAWPSLGLSDAQLTEFADGVSVTAAAQLSHG